MLKKLIKIFFFFGIFLEFSKIDIETLDLIFFLYFFIVFFEFIVLYLYLYFFILFHFVLFLLFYWNKIKNILFIFFFILKNLLGNFLQFSLTFLIFVGVQE